MNALSVDISNITTQNDFLRLVDDLNRTHIPRALKRENKTIAMLIPAGTTEYNDDKPSIEEILSLAGAWGNKNEREWEQVEQELENIRHASSPTPPLELPL